MKGLPGFRSTLYAKQYVLQGQREQPENLLWSQAISIFQAMVDVPELEITWRGDLGDLLIER